MKKLVVALILGSSAVVLTIAQTLEEIKIAADAGDPVAQDKMAERDGRNAEAWYRKAAGQGYAHAQGKLGELLFLRCRLTVGLKPDAHAAIGEEAVKWATVAANQGDKQGEATLAQMYLEGKLVKQDLVEAYKWGDLSAKNPSLEFIVFTGGATRDAAILKMNADQIKEAQKRVAAFIPHQTRKSDLPEPAWLQQIKLSGISGLPGHRLAIINNKTFGTNDQMSVEIGSKTVSVRCLEIHESSVVISIEGMDVTRELKLP
jgi:hypothetical protein